MTQADEQGSEKLDPITMKMVATSESDRQLEIFRKKCHQMHKGEAFKLIGLLRDIRAEAQNLRQSLLDAKKIIVDNEGSTPCAETLAMHQKLFSYNKKQIRELIEEVRQVIKKNPSLHSDCGDEVTHIENYWERIEKLWPPDLENTENSAKGLIVIEKCITYLCAIIYHSNLITIPPRVNDHMRSQRVGHALDFYKTFNDEICRKSDGKFILEFLKSHPKDVDGVVDVEQGLIFKAKPNNERWKSYALIFGALILGGGLLIFLIDLFTRSEVISLDSLLSQYILMGKLYLALVCGAITHIAIGAVKQMRSSTSKSFIAIEDWTLWIHIKEAPILGGIVILWLGYALLITTEIFPLSTTAVSTLFAMYFITGYSIDSLGDLFLAKFDTIVTEKTATITKALNT